MLTFQTFRKNLNRPKKQFHNLSAIKVHYSEKATKFCEISTVDLTVTKGQLTSKRNSQAEDSPKKRTNEFVFTI